LFFWFKKKEIILDCFTNSHTAYELAKPDFAYKFFPDWFVELKKTITIKNKEALTIKNCQAFKKYYTANTIIIPAPAMIQIELGTNKNPYYNLNSPDTKITIQHHPNLQFKGMVEDDYADLKIFIPWKLKTNKFVNFFWSDPVWNRSNVLDYTVMPGVVDYKYQFDTPVNMFIKYKDVKQELNFTVGKPLVMLAPLSDCNIKIKHHIIDTLKFDYLSDFCDGPLKHYKLKKEIIQAAEKRDAMKKCPFHLR
jgi:hypothetical protein